MKKLSDSKQALFNDNLKHKRNKCVEWEGDAFDTDGTPLFYHGGMQDARALVAQERDGQWPVGKLLNTCDTPFCLNPDHIVVMATSTTGGVVFLNPDQITGAVDCQPRDLMDNALIDEYCDGYKRGDAFPPVVSFYDGTLYWLADGYHRREAAVGAGLLKIPVIVFEGGRRDAQLYAMGANAEHGARRTARDKRRAVSTLLIDEEWGQWSDREIARRTRVTHPTVAAIRSELIELGTLVKSSSVTYTDRDGVEREMDISNIGKREAKEADEFAEPTFYKKVGIVADAYRMARDELMEYLVNKAYNDLQNGLIPSDVVLETEV